MIKNLPLSYRLKTIATYLSKGTKFIDIGSDHAYLPSYVCLNDPSAKAIAGEVNEGPFNSAKQTIKKYDLTGQIEVRLGDGLDVLRPNDSVYEVVIAGMGGTLIRRILENGQHKLRNITRIIAQPNIDERDTRIALTTLGYTIVHEQMIEENEHIYEIIVADLVTDDNQTKWTDKELFLGKILLSKRDDLLIKKWQSQLAAHRKIIQQMKQAKHLNQSKIRQFEKEQTWMEEVLANNE